MKILDHATIIQKIKRLSIEILENNYNESEIIIAGINNNGMLFANLLLNELKKMDSTKTFTPSNIRLNPADPVENEISFSLDDDYLKNKVIIIVDDVGNTGRTLFYACKPLFNVVPKKIETIVLVDRTHKSFPIKINYFGLSLSTTLKENIKVQLTNNQDFAVYLQ